MIEFWSVNYIKEYSSKTKRWQLIFIQKKSIAIVIINKSNQGIVENKMQMYVFWLNFTDQVQYFYQPMIQQGPIPNFSNRSFQEFETNQMQKWKEFDTQLVQQLQKNHSRYEKKVWETEEIDLLIQKRQAGLPWRQISEHIEGANPQICKRKYNRSLAERAKWPQELDERVKFLYQKQKKEWKQIFEIICQENIIYKKIRLATIKQRYHLHLRQDINRQGWSLQEDVKLLNCLKEHGKKWKTISNIFENRTELQTKNRFYGTLLPILRRVAKSTRMDLEILNKKFNLNDL